MKLVANFLLLSVICGLFEATSAGITDIRLDLIEKLKFSEDLPEAPLVVEEETLNYDNGTELAEGQLDAADLVPEARKHKCSIQIRSDLTNKQPIFLETNATAFYPYSKKGFMQVESGKTMQLFCPDKFNSIDKTLITATCVSETTFKVDGTKYKFSEFICKSWPAFVIRKTGIVCNGGTLLKVGFEITPLRFVEQMEICFNEEEEVTRYVYHTLQPGNNFFQTGVERTNFQTAGFFDGKDVDKLYTQKSQQEIIDADLRGVGQQYFNVRKNVFLARGHLNAKADSVYGSQQRATFIFVNVAPQWQVFNAGNWARVEDGVRAWVSKKEISVDCYTGTYGVTTLPNIDGQETPLYLARDANNNGLIPVPMLYFRVVIEPATKRGIVFVGVNNPHLSLEQIERDYIICNDVSDQVNYINWKKTDITAGYSYACEVSDFLKAVKTLPKLSAKGGLLV